MRAPNRLDRGGDVALHGQLYARLRRALADGTYAPGQALPSEPSLAQIHRVSRTTVRRALARLAEEGRVARRHGSGTYVLGGAQDGTTADDVHEMLADLKDMSERTTTRLISFRHVATPDFVRAASPDFSAECLCIERTRSAGGVPFSRVWSYVPTPFAGRLTREKLGNDATLVALTRVGARPARAQQSTTAVAATTDLARDLRVPTGSPLCFLRRHIVDAKGKPVEYVEYAFVPDLYEERLDLRLRRRGSSIGWQPSASGHV
jgi:GntR family transcriptional regulator